MDSLTLAFDGTPTLAPRDAEGRASLALTKALLKVEDPQVRLRVFIHSLLKGPGPEHDFLLVDAATVHRRRSRAASLYKAWRAASGPTVEQLVGAGTDAFVALGGPIPPGARPPRVVFACDPARPDAPPEGELLLAPSAWRRAQLEALGVDEHRLATVPLGFDASVFHPLDERMVHIAAQDAGLPAPPFLMARSGTGDGARNRLLLDVYEELQRRLPKRCPELIVEGWNGDPPPELRARPHLYRRVIVLGASDEKRLAGLFGGSAAVIIPTAEAAHGLDIVEPLACGAPVVCPTGSAYDEFGGEAVQRIAGNGASDWADAVEMVAFDPDRRHEVSTASIGVSANWSADKTAMGLLESLRGLVV